MQMSSLVLSLKEFKSFRLSEAATAIRMVFNDKINKRLANGHAYLNRFAWLISYLPATALKNSHIRRSFEHQIPGVWIRDNLFNALKRNVVIMCDNCPGKFRCEYLAMIMIGQPLLTRGP
jgi:hypothetical protein